MALYEIAKAEKAEALTICCKLEEEIAELEPAEKDAFLTEQGIGNPVWDQHVKAAIARTHQLSNRRAKESAPGRLHADRRRRSPRANSTPILKRA
jgi:ribosome-binding ATPase YchF (GTP1/OBG family)